MRYTRLITALAAGTMVAVGSASAQTPPADPSAKLAEVLPAGIAEQVLSTIAAARARGLPAQALESRALKYAARGVNPATIRSEIAAQSQRMEAARGALQSGRGGLVEGEEIEAGADVLAKGVDGAAVSELARSAPSGRSLTVPLFVLGSLVDRGLPSAEALQRVVERLQARASDADIEALPAQAAAGRANRPQQAGRGAGVAGRPAGAGPGAGAAGGVGISGPPSGTPGPTSRPSTPRGRP
ncbi:hypothetical protein BH23GEM2_BH23GEM2_08350 [soil metagenome]